MKIRATQAIMECLLEQEVDTIFGYPGGTILNLYDELYRYQDKIRHILTAHEQGASHAADGYARSTGKVGVCFATSGPGATNLTTGIATAYMDSSPVVFITCNVGESLIGKDSFQEVDITGIAMPITKATYLVRDANTIPDVMRQAFAVAATGRPGPVLIDFLKNVTAPNVEIDYEFVPWSKNRSCNSIRALATSHELKAPEPNLGDIDTLVEMISQSERPMLICGGGVVRGRAHEQFRTFAEKLDAQGVQLPLSEHTEVLAQPLAIGAHTMHNRIAVQPMEGCDGTADGRPAEPTIRRYMRFARGGAGLIWFEATAVCREGRANPRQLWLTPESLDDFRRLADQIREEAVKANGYAPLLILQATHSGRYSKPEGRPDPLIAYNNPLFEGDKPIPAERIVPDEYLDCLVEQMGTAAALATILTLTTVLSLFLFFKISVSKDVAM